MSTKRVQNSILAGAFGVIVMVGSLALVIFSPEIPASTRCIFIGLTLVFGLLIAYSLLDDHFKKLLGREMRSSPSREDTVSGLADQDAGSVKRRSAPPQPFTYQVFDMSNLPSLSPAADALVNSGYKYYRSYVVNLVIGALFLYFSSSFVWLISDLLLSQSPLSFNVLCGLTLTLLATFVVANPGRYPTSLTILIWLGLNVIFLTPIVYTASKIFIQVFTGRLEFGSVLVFLCAGGILTIYGVLFFFLFSTLRRQVAAKKPLQLLVLWVFSSANNLISILSGIGLIWQFLGSMQFLRGGGLTVDMGDLVRKKRADLVVDTPEELARGLQEFKYVPGWLGTYKSNTLLCGDAVWKPAVYALLRNADVVAMSLFGFSESNQGCLYELGLLLDTFAIQRVLFLIDDTTDLDFLLVTLSENWDNMTTDSPNHIDADIPVRIYRLSARFDRPLEGNAAITEFGRSTPSEHPILSALRLFSITQATIAREANGMLKLILESVAR